MLFEYFIHIYDGRTLNETNNCNTLAVSYMSKRPHAVVSRKLSVSKYTMIVGSHTMGICHLSLFIMTVFS
jgi:hypothetical protein